jgi:hypothetical protein
MIKDYTSFAVQFDFRLPFGDTLLSPTTIATITKLISYTQLLSQAAISNPATHLLRGKFVTVDLGKFPHSAASIKQQHSITRTSVC